MKYKYLREYRPQSRNQNKIYQTDLKNKNMYYFKYYQ